MPVPGEQEIPPKEHILACLCRASGIMGEIQIRPYYCQTATEKKAGRLHSKQICIQSIGDFTHETWMKNKLWFHERFQRVIDELTYLHPEIKIIQLGIVKDRPLEKVTDLRGKTSLRKTAAILSQSLCFIGTQGFLAHMARAVDCRSVIIYGGREHSRQSGYICNENLDSFADCAPCWKWDACDYDRKCMRMITPGTVLKAVGNVLNKNRFPLETDTITIE
jgi:ADP-heptose:LPS heptosyltransferase